MTWIDIVFEWDLWNVPIMLGIMFFYHFLIVLPKQQDISNVVTTLTIEIKTFKEHMENHSERVSKEFNEGVKDFRNCVKELVEDLKTIQKKVVFNSENIAELKGKVNNL